MSDEFDPYQPDTGIKTEYGGVICDASFQKGEGQQNWSVVFVMKCDDDDETTRRFGLGAEWGSYDGGETVEHTSGSKKARFNRNTGYSQFMVHALGSGGEEAIRARNVKWDNRGPYNAASWVGLGFYWSEVQIDSRERVTKEDGSTEWKDAKRPSVLPTRFLGEFKVEGSQTDGWHVPGLITNSGSSTSTSRSTETPASQASKPDGSQDIAPELLAKLKLLAKTHEYESFVDSVIALPEAAASDTVMTLLGQQDWYEELKS